MKKNNILKSLLILSLAVIPLTANATTKKETVFTTLNSDGTVASTTVTNHLCALTKEQYEDDSRLSEIVNLNGDESFTQDGNKITWKTNGNDIYYQGNSNEESPLDINIYYYLNDKEMPANEIKGKSGKIKIRITLRNKMSNRVKVSGSYETLYTPFVVTAGTIIDSEHNSNIDVTNGKVVNTGDKNLIASIASPGLYESLNIDQLDGLNDIEISFETTDFKMDNIYIIATPKLIDEKDTRLFKDLKKVTDNIKVLQKSINKIEDGSSQLQKGTGDLLDGIELINSKLPTKESNNENRNNLKTLNKQNSDTIKKLTEANKGLEDQVKEVETKLTGLTAKRTSVNDSYNTANTKYTSLSGLLASNPTDEYVNTATEGQITTVRELGITVNNLKNTVDALKGTVDALDGTIGLLRQTKSSLETSIEANKGLVKLLSYDNQVVTSSLNTIDSMETLSNAMKQLTNGIKELNKGATTLNNGINQFNTKGIKKLSSYSNKINNYSNRAEALVNLSKDYKGYASDNSDETIFVNKVESIK